MRIFVKRLLAIISSVAALYGVIALILTICGYRPFIIESGSMEPQYPQGSFCLVDTKPLVSDLVVGDVIAYRSDADVLVLHRVVGITDASDDNLIVEMQGDANNVSQEVTLSKINFIGKEAFTIPGLGSIVSTLISTPAIIYGLIAILIILACLPRYRLPQRRKGKEAAS